MFVLLFLSVHHATNGGLLPLLLLLLFFGLFLLSFFLGVALSSSWFLCSVFCCCCSLTACRARCNYLVYAFFLSASFGSQCQKPSPHCHPLFSLYYYIVFFLSLTQWLGKTSYFMLNYCIWRSQMKSSPLRPLGFHSAFT